MARKMYRVLFGRKGTPTPPYPIQDEEFYKWAIKPSTNNNLTSYLKDRLDDIARESYDRDFESLKSNLYKYGKNNPQKVNDQYWYDYYRDYLTDDFINAFFYPPTPSVDFPEIEIEEDSPIDDDLELEEDDPYGENPLLGGSSNGATSGQEAGTASEPVTNVGTIETGTGTQTSGGGNRNSGKTKVVTQNRMIYPPISSVHLRPQQLANERPSYSVDLQRVPVRPYIDDDALSFIKKPKQGRRRLFKRDK